MESDIVARLRLWSEHDSDEYISDMCKAAADEIERLRKEREEAEPLLQELWERRTESTELRNEIERLRVIVQGWDHSARNAERDITELRDELYRTKDAYRGAMAEIDILRAGLSEIVANKVNEPMSAEYADDVLEGRIGK